MTRAVSSGTRAPKSMLQHVLWPLATANPSSPPFLADLWETPGYYYLPIAAVQEIGSTRFSSHEPGRFM